MAFFYFGDNILLGFLKFETANLIQYIGLVSFIAVSTGHVFGLHLNLVIRSYYCYELTFSVWYFYGI